MTKEFYPGPRAAGAFPAPDNRESRYAVYGLIEWEVLLPAGAAKVRVRFAGGAMSSLGIVPATYATQSPAIKRIIETSPYFLSGKIKKIQ